MWNLIRKFLKVTKIVWSPLWRKALTYGVGAAVEHTKFLKITKCKFVVDVGANCGQFALVARVLCDTATIHSFEPLLEPAKKFQRIFADDKKVILHNLALGAKEEKRKMHISSSIDSSSLLPITALQENLFPGTEESGEMSVLVVPLHKVLDVNDIVEPALLKIDVQGYELEVLHGCESIINKFDHIYVECSFMELYKGQPMVSDVINFLLPKRFVLSGIYNVIYDNAGHSVQADFYFQKLAI